MVQEALSVIESLATPAPEPPPSRPPSTARSPSSTKSPSSPKSQQQSQSQPPVVSVAKTLSKLLSVSSNRSCGDCRATLVDPSQIYASVSPPDVEPSNAPVQTNNFRFNHHKFAPPPSALLSSSATPTTSSTSTSVAANGNYNGLHIKIPVVNDPPIDPALVAPARIGGHGVLVCALCGAAHKLLGPSVAVVHPVQDLTAWTPDEVRRLAAAGGNARSSKVLEAYVSSHWEAKRPNGAESSVADRLTFIRAKYQALAFVLPQPGPLADPAWQNIVDMHPEWSGLWGANLIAAAEYDLLQHEHQESPGGPGGGGGRRNSSSYAFHTVGSGASTETVRRYTLPDRLVDYFCVVTPSDYVEPWQVQSEDSMALLASPEDVLLIPKVSDCFPLPNAHEDDHEFPEHISTFLFPDGCRPSTMSMPPSFFTFVLTASNGDRLYGGVLRLYDDHRDINYLRIAMENSGYTGKLPDWLTDFNDSNEDMRSSRSSLGSVASDVVYLPKCLLIISHYPFFDLWRKFLLQIYRLVLVEAPLPIERFISNFTCEIPLPPPGKIQVKFGYMVKDTWSVERPPDNKLPMADFSFKPLFASLSVSNVLVVLACLLQESRVALVSQYNAILVPVAEALTSLLFPFHWEGLYLPVMPYSMTDILDAPVPYLVGLHSRYLKETPPGLRPHGVVLVDLDRDTVHLGCEDDSMAPRKIPCMPERQATKLRTKLEQVAACVYVMPPTCLTGTITSGEGDTVPMALRPSYLRDVAGTECHTSGKMRREVFGDADKAYRENDLAGPITGFFSEHGQFYEKDQPLTALARSQTSDGSDRTFFPFLRRHQSRRSLGSSGELKHHQKGRNQTDDCLLDKNDPPGFSTQEIRDGFLRFFVSLFLDYRQYLRRDGFETDDFVNHLHISSESAEFVTCTLKTQMFARFLEDRQENPDDPEVKFFDESINAKISRSKKHALGTLGRPKRKSGTSFLDDTSGAISETYTPPAPSNWGLPDDGRSYIYGRFPPLNPGLFGKIRPPRKWTRNRRASIRMTRRVSMVTRKGEQAVFAKATAPLVRQGSNIIAATKRGAKNLEYAITALSSPFATLKDPEDATQRDPGRVVGGSNINRMSVASEVTMPSEFGLSFGDGAITAEDVVLNSRRKQAILLGIMVSFQRHYRMHLEKGPRRNLVQLSRVVSMRFDLLSREAKEWGAASKIQACYRAYRVRSSLRRIRLSAARMQAFARGHRSRYAFALVRKAIIKSQARCRGFITRNRLSTLLKGCLLRYRKHILLLWVKSHTSLCYRTKFWTLVRKDGMIQLVLAEEEIIRLWIECQVQPPTDVQNGGAKDDDHILRTGRKLGVSNRTYCRLRKIEADKAFSSVEVSHEGVMNDTRDRETAERIQVYERLMMAECANDFDRLAKYFARFSIPRQEKKKKAALAEMIWNVFPKANDSSSFMLELFPELEHSPDIHFREPSKKSMRRVRRLSNLIPRPMDKHLCIHTLHGDRVRRNVREVADLSLRKVPALTLRLGRLDEERREEDLREIRKQKIIMEVRKVPDWPTCRAAIMMDFLSTRRERVTTCTGIQAATIGEDSLTSFGYPGEEFWASEENEKESAENDKQHNSGKASLWRKFNDSIRSVRSKDSKLSASVSAVDPFAHSMEPSENDAP